MQKMTLISMMKMQTGKRQPRGRNPLVILRRRWPGVRVTAGRKKLVQLFDSGEVCAFRIKYPNGTVDVFRGWLSSLGKTIASKDVMTRTVKISGVGRPYLAEEGTETVSVTGLTVSPASASVKVGSNHHADLYSKNLTEPVTKRSVCIRQIHRLPRLP